MKKYFLSVFSVLLSMFIVITAAGCGAANRNPQNQNQMGTQQGRNMTGYNLQNQGPYASPNNYGANPNADYGTAPGTGFPGANGLNQRMAAGFDTARADNIRNRIGTIDGAKQINAIVNGNTALVSYDSTGTPNPSATRDTIISRIKQLDNSITNVVVSDSADIRNRMVQLSNDIKNNVRASDLNNTWNQLIQSITPGR